MEIDFAQILKRPDVDYFLKDSNTSNTQPGNDQMAFFSLVRGYYPATGPQSPVSLVAYRVNSDKSSPYFNQLQRMGCGLSWNGVSTSGSMPLIFSQSSTSYGANDLISMYWPSATNMAADPNYECVGPGVFRMEYDYIIQSGTNSPVLSATPWDTRVPPGHTSVAGLQDVAAIAVDIAVIDPKSRVLASYGNGLTTLAGNMKDFGQSDPYVSGTATSPGYLAAGWQAEINNNNPANGIPSTAASNIRVYERTFYLPRN
jgi:hypothetical protein